MPYPLAKLAYGLRCRLSDLASRSERYRFQIAAGSISICPPMLQHVRYLYGYYFDFSPPNLEVLEYSDRVARSGDSNEKNPVYFVSSKATFLNANIQVLTPHVFANFYIKFVYRAEIISCNIAKPFFHTLAKRTYRFIRSFKIWGSSHNKSKLSFDDLLNAFPHTRYVKANFVFLSNSWISEIIQCKSTTILELILLVRADQISPFTAEEILNLLKVSF
uniref:BPI2 domain-containing protein n=1 Tax=Panagrellus redivivus TaxID=6233 RepID=A0A7E4VWH7_PANRE